jgi:DUF438 domain-containing protein
MYYLLKHKTMKQELKEIAKNIAQLRYHEQVQNYFIEGFETAINVVVSIIESTMIDENFSDGECIDMICNLFNVDFHNETAS